MSSDADWQSQPLAVLVSGGLDSAILVGELARHSPAVYPIYVRFGLIWEETEEAGLRRFLAELACPAVRPLKTFLLPIEPVYGSHWSTTGDNTPDFDSEDETVFLPGRNLLLFAQPAIWCHLQGIQTIALGVLKGNPFADSTDDYFDSFTRSVNLAVTGNLRFVRPYADCSKVEVLRRGIGMPLAVTMSCIRPVGELHCGRCNKCAERQRGFQAAGIPDPTSYATQPNMT